MIIFKSTVLLSEIEQRVDSIISMSVSWNVSSSELSTRLEEDVRQGIDEKYTNGKYKHSAYLRAYTSGYISAKRKTLVDSYVEHCYMYEGELYSISKVSKRKTMKDLYLVLTHKEVYEQLSDTSAMYWTTSDVIYFKSGE